MSSQVNPASFRDPSGFVFEKDGVIFRQINQSYSKEYDLLMQSGLYDTLVESGWLIPHEEVTKQSSDSSGSAYKTIKPTRIPFISYPYEWSFNQLKDAALLTLNVQKKALEYGMSLKDASAYNIQFLNGKPVLIDTLSFEIYKEGKPWIAYKQFCQHFLAPLSLMKYRDVRLGQLLRVHQDGIPLDLASRLLPYRTYFTLPILFHVHLHSSSQRHFSAKTFDKKKIEGKMSLWKLSSLIDDLSSFIQSLNWNPRHSQWSDYYCDDSYSPDAIEHKKEIVASYLERIKPRTLWDMGSNTGLFSRLAGKQGINVVSFDSDPACVELNYLGCADENEVNVLPLLLDLTNPSPNTGWANQERLSLVDRGPSDAVLALALIHHLAIANNVSFHKIASFFKDICEWLVIEFIPKSDPKVQRLLSTRQDVFTDYSKESFEDSFKEFFEIEKSDKIQSSERILYLMRTRK
ncbi:MAG: SAM-dependent methyltransferase [Candidatus Altiarchaeota archaeon]